MTWSLSLGEDATSASGQLTPPSGEGLSGLGDIEVDLSGVKRPVEGLLAIKVKSGDGKEHVNSWPVWVYPDKNSPDNKEIFVTRALDKKAFQTLEEGGKVLLMPKDTAGTVGGLFQTDYWNYRMFKTRSSRPPDTPTGSGSRLLRSPGQ